MQRGPAEGIWLHLNPRTGGDYFNGDVEPEVQAMLHKYVGKAEGPDFIKCDVEGAEVEVFRGANKPLNEKRPIILCEMHGDEARQTLLKVFANLGYRCEKCGKNHILAQHAV